MQWMSHALSLTISFDDGQKLACIPNFRAQILPISIHTTNQYPAIVHIIILQYVYMMMIDGYEGVISPIWYVLGLIIVAVDQN